MTGQALAPPRGTTVDCEEDILNQFANMTMQMVCQLTGLSADVIRIWERRYNAICPLRTPTNRRLYSEDDLEKLVLLKQALALGHRIGEVAGLDRAALQALVPTVLLPTSPVAISAMAAAAAVSGYAAPIPRSAAEHLAACRECVQDMDPDALDQSLAQATVTLGLPRLLQEIVLPLLDGIGQGWRDGQLRVGQEHLASATLRTFLGTLLRTTSAGGVGPSLVVTTPSGQFHEFGALLGAILAATDGWRIVYLGPSMPGAELAAALQHTEAHALFLSVVCGGDERRLAEDLRPLRGVAGQGCALLVGGAGAAAHAGLWRDLQATVCRDLPDFRALLERIRRSPPPPSPPSEP
jgi:DNA-binding transcriptional MerR regulator